MTANKRFKCVSDYDWWGVIDITGEIKGEYDSDCFSTDTVVDLLNSLSEENKQLKEQLEICKDARQAYKQDWKACVSYCDTYKDEIHTLKDNVQGLIEENKQLKKQNDNLIKISAWIQVKNDKLSGENKELQDTIDTICKDFETAHGMDIRNADWFTAW